MNNIMRRKLYGKLLPLLCCTVLAVSCHKEESGGAEGTSAVFKDELVSCETTVTQLLLEGGTGLTCSITVLEGEAWVSFSASQAQTVWEGAVTPVVFVYLQKNMTTDERAARVEVAFSNGDRTEAAFVQSAYTSSALYDRDWAEQPQFEESSDYIYKTYFTTLSESSRLVRNYSICYDTDKKVARWVAYPLHTCYTMPSLDRTNAWAYDPNNQMPEIPQSVQQYVIESYGTGYARGHQCPSADRYSTVATNEMTFYATNMMPQNSNFNSGVWGTLENKVRANIVKDTLYVVTGAWFGDTQTMTDRKGNRIGVPTDCWKVLLRTKKGNTGKRVQDCTADELIGIGFWMPNASSTGGTPAQYTVTIAEVEERTGFTFFRNLPEEVAAAVKQQNVPADWNIN